MLLEAGTRAGRKGRTSRGLNPEVNRLEWPSLALDGTHHHRRSDGTGRAQRLLRQPGHRRPDGERNRRTGHLADDGVPGQQRLVHDGQPDPPAGNSGTDVIQYFSKDDSGNVEATHTLVVKIDTTIPRLTEHATPTTLWPPNHKFDTVHVSGIATDSVSGINHGRVVFFVRDEYGLVQPRGSAPVHSNGTYSFNVQLQASRAGQDHDGRHYARSSWSPRAGRAATRSGPSSSRSPTTRDTPGGNGSGSPDQRGRPRRVTRATIRDRRATGGTPRARGTTAMAIRRAARGHWTRLIRTPADRTAAPGAGPDCPGIAAGPCCTPSRFQPPLLLVAVAVAGEEEEPRFLLAVDVEDVVGGGCRRARAAGPPAGSPRRAS